MNRYRIIFTFTAVLLGIFLCFTIGCQPDKNNTENPVEKPPVEPPEENPVETPEPPPETPDENPVETPEPPPAETPEPPPETPDENPVETPEPPPETPEPPAETPEPLYKVGAVLLIESDGYGYLARVTEDTLPDATEVAVHFFSEEPRKNVGDTVATENILTVREEPPDGWASRPVLLEYFDGKTWKYQMDVLMLEDSYLLPEHVKGERRVEFANVRFPIAAH